MAISCRTWIGISENLICHRDLARGSRSTWKTRKEQNGVRCTTYIQSGVYFGFSSRFDTGAWVTQSKIDSDAVQHVDKRLRSSAKGLMVDPNAVFCRRGGEKNLFFGQILGHC